MSKSKEYTKQAKIFARIESVKTYYATVGRYVQNEFPTYVDGLSFRKLCDRYRDENQKGHK